MGVAAAIEKQVGEMRLNVQDQSLLPEYDGKVHRVLVREGILFCEVTTPFNTHSILCVDLATGKKATPYALDEKSLQRTLKNEGKSYLRLDNQLSTSNSEVMTFFQLAEKLGVEPDALRKYIPTTFNNELHIQREHFEPGVLLLSPIPAATNLGMEAVLGLDVPIGSDRLIRLPEYSIVNEPISNPFIDRGLLKIPTSDPVFQIASKGAYEDGKGKMVSIDGDGVVSEISFEGKRASSKELGSIALPKCKKAEIVGFSGIEGGKAFYVSAVIDGTAKAFAYDRTTLEQVGVTEGVNGPIACDESGNLLFVDSENRLRVATSNLVSLEGKKIIARNSPRLAAIKGAAAALDGLTLPSIDGAVQSNGAQSQEAKELHGVQSSLFKKISPEVEKCTSLADLTALDQRIGMLRMRPEFAALPAAFEPIDLLLAGKREKFAYPEINKQIDAIEKLLGNNGRNLTEARSLLVDLNELRSSVALKDHEKRNAVGTRITQITKQLKALSGEADAQAEREVVEGLGRLTKEIDTCATQDEVLAVVMEGSGKDIREIIGQVSDKLKRDYLNTKFSRAVDERINAIAEVIKSKQLLEAEERLAVREEYQMLIGRFAKALSTVGDRKALQDQANSAVVRAARAQIEKLPEEEREEAHAALNRMLTERAKSIDFTHRVNDLSKTKGYVKFGSVEFPRAGDFEILFEPKFIPLRGRSGFLELVWIDARGKEYRPEVAPIAVDASNDERSKLAAQTKEEASKFFMLSIPRAPTVRSNWVINKHYEGYLGELSELMLYQKKLQQGLVIVEGDAGCAKSALVQMFAALTNRPMNTFACNGQTEKEDLTYLYQYDPEKGTYRLDSGFIEALQTPNTVILLEEINSLPVPVAKMLNTLFDFRRELYLPDGRIIKADPSILIVGLQNPQSYAGVNKLSKEFLSRALVMEMDYAKYKDGTKVLPYEAEMYSKYRPKLAELNQNEFYALWDKVANNVDSAEAKRVSTNEREAEIKGLKRLIDVANRARAAYRAFQREESTEPFEFIFSYREAEVIASLWNGATPIEKMIERIVLPKIPDAVEKKAMHALISAA